MNKRMIKTVCIFCLLYLMSLPVYAAVPKAVTRGATTAEKKKTATTTEEKLLKQASFIFTVYLDADISLSENDTFKIALKNSDGKEHTIEMNAFDSSNAAIENTLDEGVYTVTGIEYKGINSIINENGYGLPAQFTLSSKQSTEIPLYIGKQQTSLSGLFVIQNGSSVQTTQNTGALSDTQSSDEEQNTDIESSTEVKTSTSTQPDKKDVIEVVKKEKKSRNTQYIPFSPVKLIPIVLVAIIGSIGLFIYYKKNYRI